MASARRSGLLAIALLGLLLPASPAPAQTAGGVVAVARSGSDTHLALSGTRLLIGRTTERGVRLRSAPAAGGPARTLFSMAPPRRRRVLVMSDLDASSERIVFSLVALNPATEGIVGGSVWSGPPDGPFAPLVRRRGGVWVPVEVQTSGPVAAFTEVRPVGPAARHHLFPAAGPALRPPVPSGVARFELAGTLLAFIEGRRRLVVRDWVTGAERLRHTASGAVGGLDLAANGRALLHVPSARSLELIDESGSVTRTSTGGQAEDDVRLVAERALVRLPGRFTGDAHVASVDLATGERRRLSPPSAGLGLEEAPLDGEGELVAWATNGCAFAAPVTGLGSSLIPRGPCPRAEIHFLDHQPKRLQGRSARVRLRCVTAPPPGCRGTVRLELAERPVGRGRYLIPAGERETVRVRFTDRELAALEEEFRLPPRGDVAFVGVLVTLAGGVEARSVTPHQGMVIRAPR